jgi:uncharacterized zinc-type alcohol dehydrogenase-like protein
MPTARAFAVSSSTARFAPITIPRREPGPTDVAFAILHCGLCHSDLHTARGEWPGTVYPCVPGHELVGVVTAVGAKVTRFAVGDKVGVGCMVDSCRTCGACKAGLEQYCETHGTVFTYNSPDAHQPGHRTYGGYSTAIVVDEAFVLRMPTNLDLAAAAPLLCAGITTYSPLRTWGAGPGTRVGWSASAASATWRSSWPTRWARTRRCSPPARARSPTAPASAPIGWWSPRTPRRWPRSAPSST